MQKSKRGITLILIVALMMTMQLAYSFGAENLSYEEIEKIIEEVALEKNIPSVILKAIAWKESNYRQFDSNGNPLVSGGNTGIMQVNRVHRHLDQDRLRHDIRYNIGAGADILLNRWHATRTYPTIGDMDPNIIEHWYFALWGYNSWTGRNNPNISGDNAYQEALFQLIRERYNQPVTSIDATYLPSSGLPNASLWIPTPEVHHFGDLNRDHEAIFSDIIDHPKQEYIEELYNMGIVNGVREDLFDPDGYITKEQMAKILVDVLELELVDGIGLGQDWEKVALWARNYVATAQRHGFLFLDLEGNINPQDYITREEFIMVLFNGLKTEALTMEEMMMPLPYEDLEEIIPGAIYGIAYFYGKGVLTPGEDVFRPKDYTTRGEISKLAYLLVENIDF